MKRVTLRIIAFAAMLALLAGCAKAPGSGSVTDVRVGSLKGPTSIGVIRMMHEQESNVYSFTMETQADVLLSSIVSGQLDIALIPANVASVLYNKTKGGISVIDINTLGVLYMVSGDDSITGMKDLEGRTVYTTGAGTTPEYVLRYLLNENGLTDKVNIEFKSEATEVAAVLAEDPSAVGMLPQPFATAATLKNDALSVVLDMTKEWDNVGNGSKLVTGVTVVRNDFLKEHPDAVSAFLKDHASDAEFVNSDTETASGYVAEAGIVEKAPVAAKAIPYCNIVCITGSEMKEALSGYLQVLYDQDASSVGGNLPADDFYAEVK
ncbi:MAG: ABC transporter substrate-binding protein [Lachnospiraceae bacterium]|nr:ABC transporter substrate-binding protein [Lachnospiraceae bacterium]